MSTVPIKDAADATRKIDTFQRTEGPDTVETQAVAVVNPTTGTPIDFATQTTVAALLTAANAIKAAAESLDAKATAINTGAVAGTVAVSNMVAQGLTDAQLRATAVPVSGTFWPVTQPVSAASNLPTSKNATIFQFSTNNTSTAQLAAAATFPGAIETALDQPSISLLMTSDQPITLTVKQFIDVGGTRAVPDIVFYVAANLGFARSFTLNGNYVQVTATNTGASTTTTFSLNTAYGDLGDSESGGIMPVTELPLVLTGAAAQTATVNNILGPAAGSTGLAVSGYRTASVQVVSTATAGTFIFEQSNDGTNWIALPVFNSVLVTGVPITAAITASASAIIYSFPLRCNLVRLRIATTLTGGSVQAFTRIGTDPWTPSATLVASNTAANMQTTATVTGYPTAAASADALANPTVTKVDSTGLVFNGTTWDRVRGMSTALTTGDTGAKVATGNGATITNIGNKGVQILINMGVVSGTTPTAVFKVQGSTDAGTTWYDVPGANTAAITATGQYGITIYPGVATTAGVATTGTTATTSMVIPRTWRMVWTIGGTTPSFTITAVQYIYLPN